MINKKLLLLAIFIVSILAVGAVSAADNLTDDIVSADATDEIGVVEDQVMEQTDNEETISATDDGTFTALQEKIDHAKGSIITLENDYSYNNGFGADGLSIIGYGRSLTIDGKCHTIDGFSCARLFWVTHGAEVVFKNIIFINGKPPDYDDKGGAINGNGFTVINCTFINNHAGYGGAIYSYGCTVINCSFIDNNAGNYGGAIYNCKAVNCSFVGNHAGYGGAMYESVVESCVFNNNSADNYGGAIYNSQVSTDCKFNNNTAKIDGKDTYNSRFTKIDKTFTDLNTLINSNTKKTIYLNNNYTFSLRDNNLIDGISINRPVTICGNGHTIDGFTCARLFKVSNSKVVFKNIIFINGKTTDDDNGGAIDGSCTVINCTFINNHAGYCGGAVNGDCTVINCSFVGNHAGFGGAIYSANDCNITNCNFTDNSAFAGGAIHIEHGRVTNCNFNNNTASPQDGGAMRGGYALNCTFVGNRAHDGGAMSGGSAVNCIFVGNHAYWFAGAMDGGSAMKCIFVNNSADVCCGAMYKGSAVNCSFVNNSAGDDGALYGTKISTNCKFNNNVAKNGNDTYDDVSFFKIGKSFTDLNTLINSNTKKTIYLNNNYTFNIEFDYDLIDGIDVNRPVTICGNGHTIDGLGVARLFKVSNREVVFKNIIFINGNPPKGAGGAIYGNCTVINCTFINNGGAMYNGYAVNCIFVGNSAGYYGGAMYNGSAVNCSFVNNSAGYYGGAMYEGSAVNCIFRGNSADDDGGAMSGGYALNCTFVGNRADDGGAMSGGRAVRCSFVNNSAWEAGGALYYSHAVRCIFIGNIAHGHYQKDFAHPPEKHGYDMSHGSAKECVFVNNPAKGDDAVYRCSVVNCIFKNTYSSIYFEEYVIKANDLIVYRTIDTPFTVKISHGFGFISNQNVVFKVNGKKVQTVKTNSKGYASITIKRTVGTYKITVECEGVSVTKKLIVKPILKFSNVNVRKSASKLILKASLAKKLKGKTITFKFNGKTYKAKTDKNGVAKVTIKKSVLKKLKKGKLIKYQASYLGETIKKTARVKR